VTDAGIVTVELDLPQPLYEWIQLEADDHGFESAYEWIRTQIWRDLTADLRRDHGPTVEVEVDLSADYARRALLWQQTREAEGMATDGDLDAFLHNSMTLEADWTVDGNAWTPGGGESDD
jgi:hypothetical protein